MHERRRGETFIPRDLYGAKRSGANPAKLDGSEISGSRRRLVRVSPVSLVAGNYFILAVKVRRAVRFSA